MANIEILIQNGQTIYKAIVEEGISWETQRRKAPGKLTFTVLKDEALNFVEGNPVRFTYDGQKVFYGFVFTKQRSDNDKIKVTCYDQLRYFKNKDTYVYSNITASKLIQMIAKDFNLNATNIEDSKVTLSSVEEDKELFEVTGNALDETLLASSQNYVLYDDFGELTLKNIANMKVDTIIDEETAQSFDYSSSIDTNTYNKIKLFYNNDETGTREVYIAQDSANMNNWGVLQLTEVLQSNVNAKNQADSYLTLYNQKNRSLSIKDAAGNVAVRGGSLIPIMLNLGDIILGNYMLVENVKHTFKESEHVMTLQLIGGEFSA